MLLLEFSEPALVFKFCVYPLLILVGIVGKNGLVFDLPPKQ